LWSGEVGKSHLEQGFASHSMRGNQMKQEKDRAEKQGKDRERGRKYCNETLHYEHL
jgi:hypothetical protein